RSVRPALCRERKAREILCAGDSSLHQWPAPPDQISRADLRLRKQAPGCAALERRADLRLVSQHRQGRGCGVRTHMRIKAVVASAFALLVLPQADAAEIRLARQYSMGYLQLNVMEHQQLIEKHAKALGIPDLKVSWITLNGPAAINDALISGNIDIATGGVPGLLVLWSRTKGTPQEVRGISALSSQPFLL